MTNVEVRLGVEYQDGKFEGYNTSVYIDGALGQWIRWIGKEGVVFSAHQEVIGKGISNPRYSVISRPDLRFDKEPNKQGYSIVEVDDNLKNELLTLINSEEQFQKSKRAIENPRIKLEGIVIITKSSERHIKV